MYQYKYVTLDTGGGLYAESLTHRQIIDKYAADGWRYVGIIPVSYTARGAICDVDLIFEREASGQS